LEEDEYTEIEYIIQVTANAADAGTYCFRVTNDSVPLDQYDIYPVLTVFGTGNISPFISHNIIDFWNYFWSYLLMLTK